MSLPLSWRAVFLNRISHPATNFYVGAISNNYGGEFWDFISDTPFTSVRLVGGAGSNQQNDRLDNMVYSRVPEPATMSFLTLGGLVLIRRRTA